MLISEIYNFLVLPLVRLNIIFLIGLMKGELVVLSFNDYSLRGLSRLLLIWPAMRPPEPSSRYRCDP
jgi:hypothetical protein